MDVRSIQLMAIVKPHVGGNGVLFALNAILPLGGVLRENLKQVSILRNPWDQFSMERWLPAKVANDISQCSVYSLVNERPRVYNYALFRHTKFI